MGLSAGGRGRSILTSGAAVAGARVVTVLCSFIAIPVSLKYLGIEAFGVWAALTSMVALLAFADLGIGNGILNLLSAALGRDDHAGIRRVAATALVVLSLIGALLFCLLLAVHRWVNWAQVLGAGIRVPATEVTVAVLVLGLCVAINLPTTLVQRMQYALQMGYVNGIAQGASGPLSLAMIYLVTTTDWGLPGVVGATVFAPVLTTWASALWMFRRHPQYRLSVADVQPQQAPVILRSGLQFLFLGVVFCLCQSSDTIIIANLLGAEAASSYAVHQKYASPIAFIGGLALTPLWAAYGEAMARGDVAWVRRAFPRSLLVLLLVALSLSVVLFLLLDPLMNLWLKGRIVADSVVAAMLLVWVTVELLGKAISTFFHGVGLVAEQVWIAAVFLPTCLLAKVLGAELLGVPGVILGTTVAYTAVHGVPYWRMARRWRLGVSAAATKSDNPTP